MKLQCVGCGKRLENVRLREKTHPRTFQAIRLRLCTPCARAGGWADVDFGRSVQTRTAA